MGDTSALLAILDDERVRHPRMTAHDVQKLIFQGVFGGDHALVDRDRFTRGLREEWDEPIDLDFPGGDPMLQPIDLEGRVARIHLTPCKVRGIEVDALIDVLWNQPRRGGTRPQFDRRWEDVVRLAAADRIPFSANELAALGFPDDLPHHSADYGPTSYRIVNDVSDPATCRRITDLGILARL